MKRQETLVFGGAFNPPTLAHQAIVEACIAYAKPRGADVWLLPSASRKDKDISVPRSYRLALLRALIADIATDGVHVEIQVAELDRPALTETYETVRELERLYPERHFVWVFGSDSIATMSSWNHGDWLLEHLSIVVVQRDGRTFSMPRNGARLGITTNGLSSTELRRRLASGEAYDDMVGESVRKLLRQKKYTY